MALAQIELPLLLLPVISVLNRADRATLDAAEVLGAGRWRAWFSAIFPQIIPAVLAGWVLVFASATTSYVTQSVIGGARLIYLPQFVYREVGVLFQWPSAAAISILLLDLDRRHHARPHHARPTRKAPRPWLTSPTSTPSARASTSAPSSTGPSSGACGILVLVFLIGPILLGAAHVLQLGDDARLPAQGPVAALVRRPARSRAVGADPHRREELLRDRALPSSCVVTLITAPAAWALARAPRRMVNTVEPILLAPLVLPSLVYALAALLALSLLGLGPSFWAVLIGHSVVFAPLMFRTVLGLAQRMNPALEEASATLGASRVRTFLRVSLPGHRARHHRRRLPRLHAVARQRVGDAVPRRARPDDAAAAPVRDAGGKPRRARGGGLRPPDPRRGRFSCSPCNASPAGPRAERQRTTKRIRR